MANPEHVEVVKQGAEAIRKWRTKNPHMRFDLYEADLSGTKLSGASLIEADLFKANFTGADLTGVNFTGANLTGANLRELDLSGASLSGASLGLANLNAASLNGASLGMADISRAILIGAHVDGADLFGANFSGADISGTVFDHAKVWGTVFGDVDLSTAKSLETVNHQAPSTVGIDTLYKSKGKIPDAFLRGCGLQPWEVLAAKLYDPTLTPSHAAEIECQILQERFKGYFLSDIFISYSHEDSQFVDQVYERLKREGANVWLDRNDLVAGPLQKQVFQGIRLNDVVLLVLSESSIKSDWVENELDMARSKEKEQNRNVLCPVALDDCWKTKVQDKESDDRHLWRTLTKKNILDFSGWQSKEFEVPFRKLLDGIKRYYGIADGNA